MNQLLPPEDVLAHYGVLGMRWGIRKDRRTGVRKGTPIKGTKAAKRTPSADHIRSKSLSKKRASELSNKELRDLNERQRLVQEYSKLQSQGRRRTNENLTKVGKILAKVVYEGNKKQVNKALRDAGNHRVANLIDLYGDALMNALLNNQGGKKRRR